EIAESCPELQREFPGIEEASIRGMLEEPSREMWDHDVEALDTAVEIAEREDLEVRGSSDRDSESPEEVALDPALDRLLCLIGKPRHVEGWFDSEGEACIAHRRGLRKEGVLATFTCLGEGHWTTSPLSAKIVVDESKKARTLCFVGDLHREQCVVLELLTQHLVLTRSARTIFVEQLAIQAQRRDPSLTAAPNPSLQWCSQLTVSWKETLA
ncbi:hypothetical protein AK812_SmicGene48150, partial [Symbiodinium microadriaticum]